MTTAAAAHTSRLAHVPALDGIRGAAVAAVLAYHAGLPWARGGFLGVDAFFVLSGFLITSLLLKERESTGSVSLSAFWARRARRLLPALFLLLAGVMCYALMLAEPEELERIRGDALATLGYVANWRPVIAGDSYFDQFAVPSPLLHTWSLAIEEQWYAIWPLTVVVLLRARRGSASAMFVTSLILALGSSLLMALLHDPHVDPSRVYYGTDTRAQSLLIGAALAALLVWRPALIDGKIVLPLQIAALACAGALIWAWTTASYVSPLLYRGGFLLLALSVAVVIAAAVHGRGPVAWVLSVWPLRALGLISYGVYLWHWPVDLVLTPERTGWDGHDLFALRALATLAIAAVSYHLVEMPVRRGAFRGLPFTPMLAPAGAAVLVLGLLLVTRGGDTMFTQATSNTPPAPRDSMVLAENTAPPVRVLVVGDSVAYTMAVGLAREGDKFGLIVWNQGALGCGVLRADAYVVNGARSEQQGTCNTWAARWQSFVDVFEPDVVVLLGGAWDLYDREVDGRLLEFGSQEADAFVLNELSLAIDILSSRGAHVILLKTPHFKPRDLGLAIGGPRFDLSRIDRFNSLFDTAVQRRPLTASVIDLNSLLSGTTMDSRELSPDGVHFTHAGATMVADRLAPGIRLAASKSISSDTAPARTSSPNAPTSPTRWLQLLGHIPDTDATRSWVVMNDYARYRETFDVMPPRPGATNEELLEYARVLLFGPDGGGSALSPARITGIGDFPPQLERIAELDQDLRTDGEPFEAVWTRSNPTLPQRPERSLADIVEFRMLAGALDGLNTYTALFSTDMETFTLDAVARTVAGPDVTPEGLVAIREGLASETRLLPYDAFATGGGVDLSGSYAALVLLHADDATANANALRLAARVQEATSWVAGQPFRDVIDSVEIRAEGRLVLARLYTRAQGLWISLQATGDTLLLHQ